MEVYFKEIKFAIYFFLLVIGSQECATETKIEVKLPNNVSPGDNVMLQCLFDLDNEILTNVKWLKSNQEFFRYTEKESPKIQLFQVAGIQVQENISSLHEVQLIDVSTETDGTYTCEVSTDNSTILTSQKLDIIAKNNIELKFNSPASAGDNVLLQCFFTFKNGAVSRVKWFKSNQEFFRYTAKHSKQIQLFDVRGIRVQKNNSSIHEVQLIDVSPETGGIYTCEASTDDTILLTSQTLDIIAKNTIEVIVPSPASPGDNVLLQCLFQFKKGVVSTVKWFKSNQEFFRYTAKDSTKIQLFEVPGIKVQENISSLHEVYLIDVSTETDGTYTCEVSTDDTTLVTSRNLDVIAKNNIEVKLPSCASPGDSVLLQCLFTFRNGAVTTLKWYKSNQEFFRYTEKTSPKIELFEVPGIQVQENISSLHEVQLIDVSTETDGIYTCEVSTDDTTLYTSQKLDVKAKNNIEIKFNSPASAGDNVLLQCLFQFTDGVVSRVKWYKANQEFFRYTEKESPQIQLFEVHGIQVQTNISSLHEVQLINVSTETGGSYTCEVSTDDITILGSRTLDIIGKFF